MLLIDQDVAKDYVATLVTLGRPDAGEYSSGSESVSSTGPIRESGTSTATGGVTTIVSGNGSPKAHTFIGTAEVKAATAKMRLVQIAEEIINLLASDPRATAKVSEEITADFPAGASGQIKRAVSENAASLGFKNKTWE